MITQEQLRARIENQEKAKNEFAAVAQSDLNKRLAVVQQAEAERVKIGDKYQREILRREGAIDELKKLLVGDTLDNKKPEPDKKTEKPGTPHSRSV